MNEADAQARGRRPIGDFKPEQKRYLEGFVAGVQIAKAAKSVAGAAAAGSAPPLPPSRPARTRPGSKRRTACSRAGRKLSDPEKFKREQHPFDTYERLKDHAAKGEYPKPPDNFRWRFFGLFYCRAEPELLHVPAAHPERHPQARRSSPAWPISPNAMAAATPM